MAEKRKVIIDVETGNAVKDVDNLKDSIVDVGNEAQETGEKSSEAMESLGDSSKKAEGGLKTVSKGIKGIGTALKAAGIGLVIALFAGFAKVLGENQVVMDAISITMETVSGVIRAVVSAITDAYTAVSEATGGFDAMKKVVGSLITIALTPLKIVFLELKAGALALKLVWEKLFGDDESVLKAKEDLVAVKDELIEVGKAAIQAGKDIADNIKEAISEVGNLATSVIDNISEVSIAAEKAAAQLLVNLRKEIELTNVLLEGQIIQLDTVAEKQRQIRDDVSRSVQERLDANDKLNEKLNEQLALGLQQAQNSVKLAKVEYDRVPNQENLIKLQEAINGKKQIESDITGKQSEQLVNKIALEKELRDIITTGLDAQLDRNTQLRNRIVDNEKQEAKKLQLTKQFLAEQKEADLERNQLELDSLTEGTQLYADALQERKDIKLQFQLDDQANDQDIVEQKRQADLEIREFDKENDLISFENQRGAEIERRQLLLDDETLSQEQRRILMDEFAMDDIRREELVDDAKREIQDAQLSNLQTGFGLLKALAGESKGLQIAAIIGENAVGIGKQIIATNAANALALANPANEATFGAYAAARITQNNIALGLGIASSVLATTTAIKGLGGGGSASGGGARAGASGSNNVSLPPEFNVVGTSGTNQLAQTISGAESTPIKAYVVSTEITSTQALDRQIESDATFGN